MLPILIHTHIHSGSEILKEASCWSSTPYPREDAPNLLNYEQ